MVIIFRRMILLINRPPYNKFQVQFIKLTCRQIRTIWGNFQKAGSLYIVSAKNRSCFFFNLHQDVLLDNLTNSQKHNCQLQLKSWQWQKDQLSWTTRNSKTNLAVFTSSFTTANVITCKSGPLSSLTICKASIKYINWKLKSTFLLINFESF